MNCEKILIEKALACQGKKEAVLLFKSGAHNLRKTMWSVKWRVIGLMTLRKQLSLRGLIQNLNFTWDLKSTSRKFAQSGVRIETVYKRFKILPQNINSKTGSE